MNPMLNNFQNQLPPELIGSINQIKQNFQNIKNNQQLMNELLSQCNGMTPEQWVRNVCQWRGIDVNQLMNAIK